jgi:CheY-like chemotaxis protein
MARSKQLPLDSRRSVQSVLARKSILIVEDEPLVALDLHTTLSAVGASLISATTAGEAIKLIGYAEVSAAVVDVQLGSEDAAQVCDLLASRQIPFLFYTGRADTSILRAAWPDVPVLKKPATSAGIVAALEAVFDPAPNH